MGNKQNDAHLLNDDVVREHIANAYVYAYYYHC